MKITEECIELDPADLPEDPVISGTMLPALIGESPFASPAQAVMEICGLWSPAENGAMILGRTMETPLIKEIEEREHRQIAQPPAIKDRYDRWSYHLRNGIWGAHIDGMTDGGKTIVEVKTASSADKWVDADGHVTIPYNYYLQGSLYAWLAEADTIEYILGIVSPAAYAHPDIVPQHETVAYRVTPMHIADPDGWRRIQDLARDALQGPLRSRRLPLDISDSRDLALYRDLTRHETEDGEIAQMLARLEMYDSHMAALKDLRDETACLVRSKLAAETADGADTTAVSSDGTSWTYSRRHRTVYDYKSACADAKLDLAGYRTDSIVEVLAVSRKTDSKNKDKKDKDKTKEE